MASVARRKDEMRAWFRDYKRSCSCKICGETHPACLTFPPRDASDKLIEVSIMIQNGYRKERIMAEIAKCDVICANCHAKLHWAHFYEPGADFDDAESLQATADETDM